MIGNGNSVFVKEQKDIADALNTLKAATVAGELDEAINVAATKKKSK